MSATASIRFAPAPREFALFGKFLTVIAVFQAAIAAAAALDQRRMPDRAALETLGIDAASLSEMGLR